MAWNMPDGATPEQYDCYCGYDQADPDAEELDDYEEDYWEREDESCGEDGGHQRQGYAVGKLSEIKP